MGRVIGGSKKKAVKVLKRQSKSQAKVRQKAGKEQIFDRALSMNHSASNLVNSHSLDYPVYSHLTMRVTETMGRVRGGSKKKAVKV